MPGRVIGLGGVFVKAKNPEKLGGWYRELLGIQGEPVFDPEGTLLELWEPATSPAG